MIRNRYLIDVRLRFGPTPLRNGYHYLEALHVRWMLRERSSGACRRPQARLASDIELLERRIAEYEADHLDDALVRYVARDDVPALDGALLAVVITDRILCDDGRMGLPVLQVIHQATRGIGGLGSGIEYIARFREEAPLLTEGLVEVEQGEGRRWIDGICRATDKLVSWALPDLPPNCVRGGRTDDGNDIEAFFRGRPRRGRRPREEEKQPETPEVQHTQARLVLPQAAQAGFDRAVRMIRARKRCMEELGFGELLPEGRGVAVLLFGPPGCGKTLAARVLGRELDKEVRVESSANLQSKYFGETEKRIRDLVRSAEQDDAILVFDEADAIVVDRASTDHPAQRSFTNALLRAVEDSTGIIVFTTNAAECLDPALERRLAARIEVPPPGPAERREIWEGLLPAALPRDPAVDVTALAAHDMTGGEIKNAVLAAASEAAAREPVVLTSSDLESGIASATEGRWSRGGAGEVGFRPSGRGEV